jgi:glutamate dehydrogenase
MSAGEQLDPLVSALAARGVGRAELVAVFGAAAYRRAPGGQERLLEELPDSAARVASAFQFVDERQAGALAVRVFTPSADADGWSAAGTVVEVNVEDSPFLLSTVTEELTRHDYETFELLHPVLGVVRDPDGRVRRFEPARTAANRESFVHVELAERLPQAACARLEADLRRVVGDAQAATRDFAAMRARTTAVAERVRTAAGARYDAAETAEAAALLDWLLDHNFIFLGYREYELAERDGERYAAVRRGSGLGILADEASSSYAEPVALRDVPEKLRERMTGGDLLTVARTNR